MAADQRRHVSINSARWLPDPGLGLAYGTNKGDLVICRPVWVSYPSLHSSLVGHKSLFLSFFVALKNKSAVVRVFFLFFKERYKKPSWTPQDNCLPNIMSPLLIWVWVSIKWEMIHTVNHAKTSCSINGVHIKAFWKLNSSLSFLCPSVLFSGENCSVLCLCKWMSYISKPFLVLSVLQQF